MSFASIAEYERIRIKRLNRGDPLAADSAVHIMGIAEPVRVVS